MAYDDFKSRIQDNWRDALLGILAQARELGPKAILAFDLDSTLFDNLPRQSRILREYGEARGLPQLAACTTKHWTSGWDMRAAMQNCGLSEADVTRLYDDAKRFWQDRFFTSDYCTDDVAIEGAAAFTHAVVASGAQLAYVTGRHEGMRRGTVDAMKLTGMVLPGAPRVHLLMKPTLEENDDAYKREAHAQLGTMGQLIAAFDNEPTHANDYRRKFPDAKVIHLATDHSGRPVTLLEGVISVPNFALDA